MAKELYSQYDFIVLGEHPAALWGAVGLLEQGLKVLVLPLGLVPERNFAPQFALSALKLDPAYYPDRNADPIQILTPQRRFRLFADSQRLSDEHLFVFGKSLDEHVLPSSEVSRGLAFLYRGSETGPLLSEDWKTVFRKVNEVIYFSREPGWLKRQFLQRIQSLGGHVLSDRSLQRIFVEKRAFVGVQVEGSSAMTLGAQVLLGTNWNHAQTFFSEDILMRSVPMGWSFEIQVHLQEDSLPVGMSSYMLFVQDEAPIVEIQHVKKGEFILRTTLPYQERYLDRTEQRKIAQRLFKVLGNFIPDLEYNLKKMDPNLRDPDQAEQVDLPTLYPFRTLEDIPVTRLRYGTPGLGAQSPIQGMWMAYEEAFPRWGEWGAYQAVFQAIQAWSKQTQRPELLRINAPF